MICPRCQGEMTEVNKYGATIDTCLSCGGIWLDKGELGKIMSQTQQAGTALDQEIGRPYGENREQYRPVDRPRCNDHHDKDHHDDYDKHKRKKSLFDLFD